MKNERMTVRKCRNRGLIPIRWRGPDGVHHGWIKKTGRRWIHCFLYGIGNTRLRLEERRHITELGGDR